MQVGQKFIFHNRSNKAVNCEIVRTSEKSIWYIQVDVSRTHIKRTSIKQFQENLKKEFYSLT